MRQDATALTGRATAGAWPGVGPGHPRAQGRPGWSAVVVALGLTLTPVVPARAERQLVEGVVVRVNERILTTRDFAKRVRELAAETREQVGVEQFEKIIREATDDMCLLERAVELKIEIDDEELGAAIKQLREQNQIPDDAAFEQSLKAMDLTREQLKARIRDSMTINRVLSREIGPLPLTEAELLQRYEREKEQFRIPEAAHLQHAIFKVGADAAEEAQATSAARRLLAAARAGGDFLALLKLEVDSGAATGGDLGTVALSDLRQEVAEVVSGLRPGELSEPFRTPAGTHVVRLVERVPASYKPFSAVSEVLRERELSERYRARMVGIVEGLRKRFVVVTHPELVTSK